MEKYGWALTFTADFKNANVNPVVYVYMFSFTFTNSNDLKTQFNVLQEPYFKCLNIWILELIRYMVNISLYIFYFVILAELQHQHPNRWIQMSVCIFIWFGQIAYVHGSAFTIEKCTRDEFNSRKWAEENAYTKLQNMHTHNLHTYITSKYTPVNLND